MPDKSLKNLMVLNIIGLVILFIEKGKGHKIWGEKKTSGKLEGRERENFIRA